MLPIAYPRHGGALAWAWRGLYLAAALALLGAALLLQGRMLAGQELDIGSRLDSGHHTRLYNAERSEALPGGSGAVTAGYRWARPRSAIYFGPLLLGASYRLDLTMLSATPGSRLDLSLDGRPLGPMVLDGRLRVYRLLAPAGWRRGQQLTLGIDGEATQLPNDPRRLVALLDRAMVQRLPGAPVASLLLAAPYLPLSVLLLLAAAWVLRLPDAPGLALPALALAGIWRLLELAPVTAPVASTLLLAAATLALLAIAVAWVLQRAPVLLPADGGRATAWICGGFLLALLLFFTPRIASDGVLYYAYLRSSAIDGDWDFANEFSAQSTLQHVLEVDDTQRTETGYFANAASVGPALLWAPFFALAHGVVYAGRALGIPWQPNGYAQPYIVLVGLASALGALISMLGCYHIARRFSGPPAAALAALSIFWGSNLLFYALVEPSFAHAFSTMAATLLVWAWLRLEQHPTSGRWALVGLAGGLSVLIYWITALLLLLPALSGLRLALAALRARAWRRLRGLVGQGALAAALALLLLLPQLLSWWLIYGRPLATPHGADYITPQAFNIGQVLFSSLYGLLPWTPAFFVGLCGLVLLPRRSPWLGLGLLSACLLYIGYNASLGRWFAGGSFGMRRLSACAPFFAVGLALLYERLARYRPALPLVACALMVGWSLAVLVRYQAYLLSHQAYSLRSMPLLQFYLDGNALPLGYLPWLIGNSYPLGLLAGLAKPQGWLYLGLMGGAMGLCIVGVGGGYWRLTRRATSDGAARSRAARHSITSST